MNERLTEFLDRHPNLSDIVQAVVLIGVLIALPFVILKDKIRLWIGR